MSLRPYGYFLSASAFLEDPGDSIQEIETALVIASVTLFQHRALVKSGMRTEARTHTEDELWQLQAGGEDGRCNAQTWGLEEAPGVLGPGLAVWGC